MANFLAFDFGTHRIGVAVGQDITNTASPLNFLAAKAGIPDWNLVKKLIHTWKPKQLIVGLPLNLDDLEQEITAYARQFAQQLYDQFHIDVAFFDERLTTKDARAQLFAAHGYKGLKKADVDSMAAKLILEDWLTSRAR